MRRLLLYKNGITSEEVRRDVGSYHRWFGRVLGERAELVINHGYRDPRPVRDGIDGIILTGSASSLVDPEQWMLEAAGFVREAACAGVPVLGVCFGHQLVGHAWGSKVRMNPRGWEAGTHEVELTELGRRDPLFRGLPDRLHVNQSHRDEVHDLAEGITRLAGGAHTENQAIAVGDHVRGVQFHPEMNGVVIRRLLQFRKLILDDDAARTGRLEHHHADALLARASDTPHAEVVVRNFFEHFVLRA